VRFTALHPLHHSTYSEEILDAGFIAAFGRTAESVGFDALALTEHPAPSARWRNAGGHDAFDVFTVLGFWAGLTSRVALMPYVLVPGFRSAVLGAKQIATLDRVSGGRLIVPVGTGYLRSEGTAVGLNFDARNEVLDEAVEVWRRVWSGEEVTIHERFTDAGGVLARPTPVQEPHPPIWIGGNSARARQRVADYGMGWTPILCGEQLARTTRTAPIPDLATLAGLVDDLRRRLEAAGRDPAEVTVQLQGGGGRLVEHDEETAPYLEWLGAVEAAGVTQLIVELPADSAARAIEGLQRYGADVIDTVNA
jgi:probable F420-dependent oxidoreductase